MILHLRLGRVFGIPVGLHWSWFLVFVLISTSLSVGYFTLVISAQPLGVYWALGTTTSVLLFVSVLIHEFGHALLSLRNGIPVDHITLFWVGGVAQLRQEPRTPTEEFQIAIAGPAASLGTAAFFAALWQIFRSNSVLSEPFEWLARVNLALVVFNLIPGFPLDGGRVLRAVLWKFIGNYHRASRFTGYCSQAVAFGFIGYGVFSAFVGNVLNGIWLVLIGGFFQHATAVSIEQMKIQQALTHIKVAHVMNNSLLRISGNTRLSELLPNAGGIGTQTVVLIYEHQIPRGFFMPNAIAAIPQGNRAQLTAGDVMIPIDETVQIQAETGLLAAITLMDQAHQSVLPVFQGEEFAGVLSREQIRHYIRYRKDLGL